MLLHPVRWSAEGFRSLALRYSSPERIEEWEKRAKASEEMPGVRCWGTAWPAMGSTVDDTDDGDDDGEPFIVMARFLWRLGLTPSATVDVAAVGRAGKVRFLPLPSRYDCGDDGRCRCGCGLTAEGRREGLPPGFPAEMLRGLGPTVRTTTATPQERRAAQAEE